MYKQPVTFIRAYVTTDQLSDGAARRNAASRWLVWLSVLAYAGSLAIPAYQTDYYGSAQDHYGLEALVLGPVGFFAGHFSWIANPLLWCSWFMRTGRNKGLSFVLAFLAFVAGASFLLGKTIAVGSAGEFPYRATVGFYLWLASMASAAIAAFIHEPSNSAALEDVT